jgi:hypothetical protein
MRPIQLLPQSPEQIEELEDRRHFDGRDDCATLRIPGGHTYMLLPRNLEPSANKILAFGVQRS